MINVAIVEDDLNAFEVLKNYLDRYSKETGEIFSINHYSTAINFLHNYSSNCDIVFMDIELPGLNGMDAAKKLRAVDKSVTLIFVTNMAQFAVKGYEVDALDFVVKPVSYFNFSTKLKKALDRIQTNADIEIIVNTKSGMVRIKSNDLMYVEVYHHDLIFHTKNGKYEGYGTLKKIEEMLAKAPFSRCNSCYLVNLKYVIAIKGFIAVVGDEELQISHPRKKEFVKDLNDYIGGGLNVSIL